MPLLLLLNAVSLSAIPVDKHLSAEVCPPPLPIRTQPPPPAIKTQRPGPAQHTTRDVAPKPARDAEAARVGAAGPLIVLAPCMMRTGAAPYPRQMISEFMELSSKIDPALPVNATREVHHPTRGC